MFKQYQAVLQSLCYNQELVRAIIDDIAADNSFQTIHCFIVSESFFIVSKSFSLSVKVMLRILRLAESHVL